MNNFQIEKGKTIFCKLCRGATFAPYEIEDCIECDDPICHGEATGTGCMRLICVECGDEMAWSSKIL